MATGRSLFPVATSLPGLKAPISSRKERLTQVLASSEVTTTIQNLLRLKEDLQLTLQQARLSLGTMTISLTAEK